MWRTARRMRAVMPLRNPGDTEIDPFEAAIASKTNDESVPVDVLNMRSGDDDFDPPSHPPQEGEPRQSERRSARESLDQDLGQLKRMQNRFHEYTKPEEGPLAKLSDDQLEKLGPDDPSVRQEIQRREEAKVSNRVQAASRELQQSQLRDRYDAAALQDFPGLADENSEFFNVTATQVQALAEGGYRGPDIVYRAATEARQQLGATGARERSRERRIDRGTGLSKPGTRPSRQMDDADDTQFSSDQMALARDYGLVGKDGKMTPAVANRLRENLKDARRAWQRRNG